MSIFVTIFLYLNNDNVEWKNLHASTTMVKNEESFLNLQSKHPLSNWLLITYHRGGAHLV